MLKKAARLIVFMTITLVLSLSVNAQIVINELGIAPSSGDAAGGGEFIELYNQGGCSGTVDISCYVLVFSSSSTSGNATGFTITIPSGTVLQPCSYYLIGGSGLSPTTNWTALAIGGNNWTNTAGANGRAADLDISMSYNSALQGLRPGNLVNTKGQVSLLTPTGTVVASVSYNSGYNAATFTGSFSNPAPGCTAISPIAPTGAATANVTATFSGSGIRGIYLDATGGYQTETSFTPGKANSLNGGTQVCCNPTITIAPSTPSRCFSAAAQTTTLAYTATTNSPTTYSITWNATPANSFAAVTNAALPASPITINIPAGTPAGVYTGNITVQNSGGCSSCSTPFTVTITSSVTSTTNVSICPSQLPYTWNGHTYNTAGTYNVTLISTGGCDSIATLNLTVKSNTSSTTNVAVCPAQIPYSWNGNSYTTTGSYNVTLVNAAGCDSIATLNLTIKSNTSSTTNIAVCPAQIPYSWNTHSYTTAGTYLVTLVNAVGCDSVATLNLTVKSNSASTTNVSVCPAQVPYSWNGNNYSTTGTYNITLTNAAGCDSIATLNLTVKLNTSSTTNISVCPAQIPYSWNSNSYTTSGSYTVTLVNAAGCDSVATLNLTVKANTSSATNISICPAQIPYTWNAHTYNTAGTYSVTLVNAAGCDSVATLNLTVKSNTTSTTNIAVCPSQMPYSWNAHSYTTAGTFVVTLVNAAGCDSVATLNLTLKANSASTTNVSICPAQIPYSWNGNSYTTTGTYNVTFVNAAGCDSIATLNLTVKPNTSSTTNVSVCPAQIPYSWNGNSYTTTGSYNVTLVNAAGCDSVATLNLTVKSNSASTTNIAVCPAQVPYVWNGNSYNTAGTYNITLVNAAGCDSLATLNLSIKSNSASTTTIAVCPAQLPYTWNAHTYNTTGSYNVTLTNAAGCDSIATLNLTVKPTATSTTNQSICKENLPFAWNNQSYTASGTYTVTLTSASGCDSIATLNLTVNQLNPLPKLRTDTTLCPGELVILNPGLYPQYLWQDLSNLSSFTVSIAGIYSVEVTDLNGCKASSSVKISYYPACGQIYFPTGFTPNGDGLNDKFGPLGNLSSIKTYSLKIFDRWGQLVFSTSDPSQSWTGSGSKNKINSTTVYVWEVEYTLHVGGAFKKKGMVTKIL